MSISFGTTLPSQFASLSYEELLAKTVEQEKQIHSLLKLRGLAPAPARIILHFDRKKAERADAVRENENAKVKARREIQKLRIQMRQKRRKRQDLSKLFQKLYQLEKSINDRKNLPILKQIANASIPRACIFTMDGLSRGVVSPSKVWKDRRREIESIKATVPATPAGPKSNLLKPVDSTSSGTKSSTSAISASPTPSAPAASKAIAVKSTTAPKVPIAKGPVVNAGIKKSDAASRVKSPAKAAIVKHAAAVMDSVATPLTAVSTAATVSKPTTRAAAKGVLQDFECWTGFRYGASNADADPDSSPFHAPAGACVHNHDLNCCFMPGSITCVCNHVDRCSA